MWSIPEVAGSGRVTAAWAVALPGPDDQLPATPATARPLAAAAEVVRNCLRESATPDKRGKLPVGNDPNRPYLSRYGCRAQAGPRPQGPVITQVTPGYWTLTN